MGSMFCMSKKLKIAFYCPEINNVYGGAYTFVESLIYEITNLNNDNFDIYIVTNKDIVFPPHIKSIKLFEIHDDKSKKKSILKSILRKIVIKIFPELTHFNSKLTEIENLINYRNDYNNKINTLLEKNSIDLIWFLTPEYIPVSIPFVVTVWDLAHRIYPFFPEVHYTGWTWEARENFYKTVLPKASFIITGTEEGKKQIEKFYNIHSDRIRVISFPTPNFEKKSENNSIISTLNIKSKYLFYPAQFWPHKNHVVILKAIEILKKNYDMDFDVIFTGSDKGNFSYIKNIVREMNMEKKVHFPGFLSIESIVELYKNAFALVFPSFFGPDNIPPLEAFSLGCPVISSNIDGSIDQLEDAALFFNPIDEQELSKKIYNLATDSKLRNDMIKKGYDIAAKRTSKNYIEKMSEIINLFEKYKRCWSNEEKYVHL